ncbi:hypothetical protein PHYBOEH_010295 [Phytophthora boehmeriae]|uniref:Phosphatidic acid phosphatase type 2/haloperoxidase domain-containing protein n=1 Tax=Phytophthora boehmeriae TaxID=109152 RepID=A0A8T1X6L7_9STRA|nr:hypothetical protein PHYBOEH_010295 [Phytophthora boehmeriae]
MDRAASGITNDVPFMESTTPGSDRPKWKRIMCDYRLLEFFVSVIMYGFALFFAKIDVAQRDIPNIEVRLNSTTSAWARDPTINNKEHTQQVPMAALVGIGVGMPIIINLIVNYALPKFRPVRIIQHDTRDFLLTIVMSTSMATLLTQFVKNMTGRFRPCFYDMCKWNYDVIWDGVTNLCTSASGEKEGRKSFPSGHASFAWSTMLVLTLYLLGRSTLNCQNRGESATRGGRKTLELFVCFIPSFLAAWVAVTRSIDNWHHYADILAGSIIGAASACLSYNYNYASIFSKKNGGVTLQQCNAYRKDTRTANDNNMAYIGSNGQTTESAGELVNGSKSRNEYVVDIHSR